MAQIIKHRRGSISAIKDVTARVSELVMATGSIGDLNGPFLFVGESEGVAGGYRPVSKIYQGTTAPTITVGSHGSTIDGTPFYAEGNKSLYILNKDGNSKIDLTGNIEGNIISAVTINNLTGTTATFDAVNLSTISFTGLTEGRLALVGPTGSIVDSGSLNFNNGELGISGSIKLNTDAYIYNDGALYIEDHTNGVQVQSNNWVDLQSNGNYVYLESGYNEIYSTGTTDIYGENRINIYSQNDDIAISSYSGHTLYLNTDGGEGDINVGNYNNSIYGHTTITDFYASDYSQLSASGSFVWVEAIGAHLQNDSGSAGVGFTARPNGIIEATGSLHVYGNTQISGNTSMTGSLIVSNGAAIIDQGVISQNSNVLLTSGSNLIIQDGGNANIAGNVYITGSEYVDNIYTRTGYAANALHLNGGTYGAPDVELTSAGNISLFAEGGNPTINVTGSIKVTGDVTVEQSLYVSGNIYQTGSFYTQGDVILSGSINIGDNIGVDTINFQGEVSSSILPKINAAFDLGSELLQWNDLYVTGTAHVGILNANTISLSGITVFNDLIVSGSSYLGRDGGDQVIVSGSMYLDSLTQGRFVIVGAEGQITDNSNFNYDGGQVGISGSIKLNETAYLYNDGPLYLQDTTNGVQINGGNGNKLELNNNGYVNLYSNGNGVDIEANGGDLWLWSDYNDVWIGSYDGSSLNLNHDGGEGDVYVLNGSNKININGNSNFTGSVNISGNTAMTGSLIVSNASGVFNSSLIVNNSDLTLDGGTNQHMNDGAHLYFDTCVDMYYDGGTNNFVFYNDCNAFSFQNNVSITGSINVSNGINTDNIYGASNSSNVLRLYGGSYNAPNVELASSGQISLFSEGGSGVNYAINMTGSVHMNDSLDVTGSVYAGGMINYNSSINGGGIYIDSGNYSEISYNDEEVYIGVDGGGIWGTSNSGQNQLTSNAGDTTINANNGHYVNINATNININGSTAVTGTFTVSSGSMTSLGGNLYVSGNLEVLGSQTNVNLEAHTVNIGDNIILVNAYSPFQRYAGLAAYDSGSADVSGSLLWDSLNDYWMFISANGSSSKFVGTTSGAQGSETNLTSGTFPIANGDNNIADSLLTYSGTTLAYNTNKFTIDSSSGNTYIDGNVKLGNLIGFDSGSFGSYVTFLSQDNDLGYIDSADTQDVTTQLLGYDAVDGTLKFSSVIDGGVY